MKTKEKAIFDSPPHHCHTIGLWIWRHPCVAHSWQKDQGLLQGSKRVWLLPVTHLPLPRGSGVISEISTPRMNPFPLEFILLTSYELSRSSGSRTRDFWGEVRLADMVMVGLKLYSLRSLKLCRHL